MKKTIFLAFFAIISLVACTRKTKVITTPDEVVVEETTSMAQLNFLDNKTYLLSDVLAKAKAEKKLVFIDAYATWCAPCKVMDKEVFSQKSVVTLLEKDFIAYKVNVEKNTGPTLSLLYEISTLPTLIVLDADGKVLSKKEAAMGATQFTAWINSTLKKR